MLDDLQVRAKLDVCWRKVSEVPWVYRQSSWKVYDWRASVRASRRVAMSGPRVVRVVDDEKEEVDEEVEGRH